MRIPPPNFTQVPNVFADEIIQNLKEVEIRVMIFIMRKTFGWHKVRDRISLSQMEQGTGCSRNKICNAIDQLERYGLILKIVEGKPGAQKTYYEINIQDSNNSDQSQFATSKGKPSSNSEPGASSNSEPGASSNLEPTKETITKETLSKETTTQPSSEKQNSTPNARSGGGGSSEKIFYKNRKGEAASIEQSLIYRKMLESEMPTEIVTEAIRQLKESEFPIGDVYKYIHTICLRLVNYPKSEKFTKKYQRNDCKKSERSDKFKASAHSNSQYSFTKETPKASWADMEAKYQKNRTEQRVNANG